MVSRLLRNSSWQLLALAAPVVAEFVTAYQITDALGLEAYGLLSFAYAFGLLFHLLLDLRLTEAAIQFLAPDLENHREQVGFRASQFVALEVSVRLLALMLNGLAALGVVLFVSSPMVVPVTQVTAATLCLNYLVTGPCRGILRICDGFAEQAIIAVLSAAFKVAAVTAVVQTLTPSPLQMAWTLLWATLPLPFLYLLGCSRVLARLGLGWARPNFSFSPPVLRFVRFNYVASLTMIPTRELDVTLLAGCTDMSSLGAYKLAKSFVSAVWILGDAFFLACYPELSRRVSRNQAGELRPWLSRQTLQLGGLGAILSLTCWVFLPPLLRRFFPSAGSEVAVYFRVMILSLPIWMAFLWLNPLILALGKAEVFAYGSFLGGAAVTMLYLICIPLWQSWGAALVTALSTPLVLLLIFALALRRSTFEVACLRR
ncbi:lipopolysaccharide biosynthesis protein [bacterium]|nr:lipopolysaccharide biosynthesis protein [bacterium]